MRVPMGILRLDFPCPPPPLNKQTCYNNGRPILDIITRIFLRIRSAIDYDIQIRTFAAVGNWTAVDHGDGGGL